ncbi:hypothetical protein KSP40_PGU021331 [Platanthera guangdongensis]|uniref:Uncharacterized protein n=1 Tax=Platanthera guangdongensis TaxID=2320717 RepID=A0ABR2LJD9_9ASPA
MSLQYLEDWWTHVTKLHGVDKYAVDAYAIFCVEETNDLMHASTVILGERNVPKNFSM